MTRFPLALAFCTLVAFAAGCDSLLDPEPLGIEVIENQLATPEGAVPFVNGLYSATTGIYASYQAPAINILESGTDDGWPRAQYLGGFKTREVDGSEGDFSSFWGTQLTAVSRINIYLDREGDIDWTGREALRNQLRGEALFLRGLYYFNLVRVFGDVPIYTDPALIVADVQAARNPTTEVYTQIKSDLGEAVSLLPDTYSGSGLAQERGRATSGTARTALAKVHLTLEEWQDVLDVTDPISGYSLRPNYIDNFYGLLDDTGGENRIESIFEAQLTELGDGPKSQIRVTWAPRARRDGQGQILPTSVHYTDAEEGASAPNGFVEAFEEGDARRDVILSTYDLTASQTSNYFLPEGEDENGLDTPDPEPHVYKWWSDVPNNETRWNVPIFRYAEVILMRAEALNELGQSGAALGLVDQIRTRAGLPALASDDAPDDQGSVRDAVRQERRIEFAFEYKRHFDLNRWGILTDRLAPQGIQIDPSKVTVHPITGKRQVLFPVPLSEIQNNPNATQNEGY